MSRLQFPTFLASFFTIALIILPPAALVFGQDVEEPEFQGQIEPLLQKYCLRCHNGDEMKSGVRVDQVSPSPTDRQLFLLRDMRRQLADETMPPEDEPQPTAEERKSLVAWIERTMAAARSRGAARNGSVRRLTVAQYRNTLRDLLGLQEDLTQTLPPDGVSKDGFANNAQAMVLSPLQVETYFEIADKALDLCLVDPEMKPVIQNFKMELGKGINAQPCPDQLVLGALNELLANSDFVVTELTPDKPFAFEPFRMRTAYDFIEGYVGNDTIRGWRKFDSIYHSVFACMRGSSGYPKGQAYEVVPDGLLLRPAIPSPEIFGQSNTYGPMANFKISLRELPEHGNFRVKVLAARYDDGLLLDAGGAPQESADVTIADLSASREATVAIKDAGIYQVDIQCASGDSQGLFSLGLADRSFTGQLLESKREGDAKAADATTPFLLVRLSAGDLKLSVNYGDNSRLRAVNFTRIADDSELARRFATFERRTPSLGVHLGLRRDCGSTLTRVGPIRAVSGSELQEYTFEGAIANFPSPDVEKDNVNYLAGIREIGVRSEYTDGRDMPRLLIRSVEFEGPYYDAWPPASYRSVFIDSPRKDEPAAYAREVIRSFATRAFRRPITAAEEESLFAVWQDSFVAHGDFRQNIKDALVVVLTSPQFLFLIETSATPDPEDLDSYELASKLSYFLWNTAPDARLLELAEIQTLRDSLDDEIERMIHDPKFGQFVSEFASQWLSLDKFDVVAVDAMRHPTLTRDAKTELRQEPVQFLRYLIENNLPLANLLESDFIVANETVAAYYNLAERSESGFRFEPIVHENQHLGGVLTQAAILSGLSDGRESNPVKRGAWLARKIIARPPDDPPPNVPKLPEDDGKHLSLREKLERHRNQKGCANCHAGIDPWGLPFESFDAGGLLKKEAVDCRSTLPGGVEIQNLMELKTWLAGDELDQVAYSLLKHLATYAVGRSLSYNELVWLQEEGVKLKSHGYPMQAMIRFVVHSNLFLKK